MYHTSPAIFTAIFICICGLCCQKQVSQAGISNYILQFTVGCNYLPLPGVPVSGNKVHIYTCSSSPSMSSSLLTNGLWLVFFINSVKSLIKFYLILSWAIILITNSYFILVTAHRTWFSSILENFDVLFNNVISYCITDIAVLQTFPNSLSWEKKKSNLMQI